MRSSSGLSFDSGFSANETTRYGEKQIGIFERHRKRKLEGSSPSLRNPPLEDMMVNKTKSGIIAAGDPMSVERIKNEARIAIEMNMGLLKKTDEGRYLIRVFVSKTGMNEDERNFEDYLHEFLRGFLFAYDLPYIKNYSDA